MDKKLTEYRTKKRRQALLNTFKEKLWNMVSFNQVAQTDPKKDHVIVETEQLQPPLKQTNIDDDDVDYTSDTDSLLSSSTLAEEEPEYNFYENSEESKCFKYFTYTIYFLFWATCYAIAIQLSFGTVYFLFSCLFGIYINTRTGPKSRDEISAYSVFNENCHAIDGTLKAEQFEREIRGGIGGMRMGFR